MINKSKWAVVRFCYHSYNFRPNWTPLSPVTISFQYYCHIEYSDFLIIVIFWTHISSYYACSLNISWLLSEPHCWSTVQISISLLNSSYILEMLFVNFVYGHAIEITMRLISYANMSSDFLGEVLTRTAVTFFRTSKYVQRYYESELIRATDRLSRPITVYLFQK